MKHIITASGLVSTQEALTPKQQNQPQQPWHIEIKMASLGWAELGE